MKYLSGKALIDLLELADFELFTLAAAGVIPISPDGKPLETPWSGRTYEMRVQSMRKLEAGCEYCSTTIFNEPLDPIPKTWADLNSGQGTTSVRAVLLSELREAMFLFDQVLEHYPSIEREIETQQSKKADEVANASSAMGTESPQDIGLEKKKGTFSHTKQALIPSKYFNDSHFAHFNLSQGILVF